MKRIGAMMVLVTMLLSGCGQQERRPHLAASAAVEQTAPSHDAVPATIIPEEKDGPSAAAPDPSPVLPTPQAEELPDSGIDTVAEPQPEETAEPEPVPESIPVPLDPAAVDVISIMWKVYGRYEKDPYYWPGIDSCHIDWQNELLVCEIGDMFTSEILIYHYNTGESELLTLEDVVGRTEWAPKKDEYFSVNYSVRCELVPEEQILNLYDIGNKRYLRYNYVTGKAQKYSGYPLLRHLPQDAQWRTESPDGRFKVKFIYIDMDECCYNPGYFLLYDTYTDNEPLYFREPDDHGFLADNTFYICDFNFLRFHDPQTGKQVQTVFELPLATKEREIAWLGFAFDPEEEDYAVIYAYIDDQEMWDPCTVSGCQLRVKCYNKYGVEIADYALDAYVTSYEVFIETAWNIEIGRGILSFRYDYENHQFNYRGW